MLLNWNSWTMEVEPTWLPMMVFTQDILLDLTTKVATFLGKAHNVCFTGSFITTQT